ncbi:hypothetical protein MTO96_024583 [Rhipicephalus appendiculatus]
MVPPDDREQWQKRSVLTFALVSFALGPSKVVTFPYLIYDNGGGTTDEGKFYCVLFVVFVAVYIFLVATVGLSMLYLETFLGQFSGLSIPQAFGGFPMAKGLGWTMVYTAVLMSMFETPLMAYCLIYMAECFALQLPWQSCPGVGRGVAAAVSGTDNTSSVPASSSGNLSSSDGCYEIRHGMQPCVRVNSTLARRYWSSNYTGKGAVVVQAPSGKVVTAPIAEYEALRNNCINGTLSSQEYHFRKDVLHLSPSIDEFGAIQVTPALVVACCWFLVFLSVSIGTVYTTFALLGALCAAALVLDGSSIGLQECFKPDVWKVVDIKTWHSASRHLFYSLGLSVGTTTCLASYSDFQDNILRLVGALFVFSLYGNLAHSFNIDIDDIRIDYTFVGFPEITSPRYLQRLWCFAFYLMIFVLSFGSLACLVGGFLGSLKDNYAVLRRWPVQTALLACAGGFVLTVPMTFQGGLYVIELLDDITYGDLMPWMGIAELLAIAYGYGCDRLRNDIFFMFEMPPPRFLTFCWRYLCPLVLAVIALNTFTMSDSREYRYQRMFSAWTGVGQLAILACVMVIVGSFVISTLAHNKYDLYAALEPETTYGPRGRAEFMRYHMYLADRNALPCSKSPESRRDVLDVGASPAPSSRLRASQGGANAAAESNTLVWDKPKIVVVSSTGIVEASGCSVLGAGAVVVDSVAASGAASPPKKSKNKGRTRK